MATKSRKSTMRDYPDLHLPAFHEIIAQGVPEKIAMAWHNAIQLLASHAHTLAEIDAAHTAGAASDNFKKAWKLMSGGKSDGLITHRGVIGHISKRLTKAEAAKIVAGWPLGQAYCVHSEHNRLAIDQAAGRVNMIRMTSAYATIDGEVLLMLVRIC